jgi:hypothetical protein
MATKAATGSKNIRTLMVWASAEKFSPTMVICQVSYCPSYWVIYCTVAQNPSELTGSSRLSRQVALWNRRPPWSLGTRPSTNPDSLRPDTLLAPTLTSLPSTRWNIGPFALIKDCAVTTTSLRLAWHHGLTWMPMRTWAASTVSSHSNRSVPVQLDGVQIHLAPGQTVIPHAPDRDLDVPTGSRSQP